MLLSRDGRVEAGRISDTAKCPTLWPLEGQVLQIGQPARQLLLAVNKALGREGGEGSKGKDGTDRRKRDWKR